MHFVIIFLAVIWLFFGFVKEKHNSYVIASASKDGLEEAARKFDIPMHLAQKYKNMATFRGLNQAREGEIVREIAKELGVHPWSCGVMNNRHYVSMTIHPEPIEVSKEEYNSESFGNNYDIDVQVYPLVRERCNNEGFLTTYQAYNLEGFQRRFFYDRAQKYIWK